MKIFSAAQIREADKFTIQQQGISGDELMERAAVGLFKWFHQQLNGAPVKIRLFCGIGNNGGDGLALARHLWEHGYDIAVYVVDFSKNRSEEFLGNLSRLKERKIWPEFLEAGTALPEIGEADLVVDAIFGNGLSRPPAPWVTALIGHINASEAYTLAIDIPSGLYMHQPLETPEAAIRANIVLSIQAPKLVFFLPDTGPYTEHWELIDIGLDPGFLERTPTEFELIGKPEALDLYKPRTKFSHKGSYGHALIVGGSYGKIGAAMLAAEACLKTGSGLVTACIPKCGYLPFQTRIPELMVVAEHGQEVLEEINFDFQPDAIGIGMGLGVAPSTVKAFGKFLKKAEAPLVIDADGLNILSKKTALLKDLPPRSVLTPHPGEFARLIGKWNNDFEKLERARDFCKKYDCILVLKGAHTLVFGREAVYVNSSGNPGMATAGSGDVLAGMITALLAQGYEPESAAVLGVFLHGLAGDLGALEQGVEALTAREIIGSIGPAYQALTQRDSNGGAANTE